jgi:hypothetical protein
MTAHILRRAAGAAVMVSAVVAGWTGTPTALAQDGDPRITVEAVHPLPDAFHFIVDVADASGEPLSDKVVTATATSPSGAAGSSVTLEPAGDGVYQGPLDLPENGTWTVRIASTDPAASIDYQYAVGGGPQPTTTTVPTDTTAAAAAGGADVAPATTTTSAARTGTDVSEQAAADSSDGDSLPVVLIVVGGAFLVAMAGVPLALRTIREARKRNRPSPPEGG